MGKNNRMGQAAVLTDKQLGAIEKELQLESHQLFWAIARYTGERWGAICRLQVSDAYHDGKPREAITFPAGIRKGKRQTRQVPISKGLKQYLVAHSPAPSGWLFPGRVPGMPITLRNMDNVLRRACKSAGIAVGVSTHSTRRTVVTNLVEKGINPRQVQEFIGWARLEQVTRYAEVSDQAMTAVAEAV